MHHNLSLAHPERIPSVAHGFAVRNGSLKHLQDFIETTFTPAQVARLYRTVSGSESMPSFRMANSDCHYIPAKMAQAVADAFRRAREMRIFQEIAVPIDMIGTVWRVGLETTTR